MENMNAEIIQLKEYDKLSLGFVSDKVYRKM